MDYGENKNLTNSFLSTEFNKNDNQTPNFIKQFSCTLLEEGNNKSDLKLKISKLEAYSRQLCMNLIDLQKNREDITNKTLALSAELECTENETEAIYSEPNVDVSLPIKKRECCSICMGDIKKDLNNEWDYGETDDLCEPCLDAFSLPEVNVSQCCCCMYSQNHESYDCFCEKCHNLESNIGSNSASYIFSDHEILQHAQKMSRGDSNFCCVCSNFEEPFVGHCHKICECEEHIVDGAEELFGGRLDCVETLQKFMNNNNVCLGEIESNTQSKRICESCGRYDIQDSASPSHSSKCKLIKISEKNGTKIEENKGKLQNKCSVEEASNVERVEDIEGVFGVPQNTANSRSKNQIFDNEPGGDSKTKINGWKRSERLRHSETTKTESWTDETKSGEQQSMRSDFASGLFVLFVIILSYASRSPDLSLSIIYFDNFSTYLRGIFDISKNERIAKLIDLFNREFSSFQKLFYFLTNNFTFLGAVFGSISFLKSVWSVAKNLYFFLRKDSYDCYPYFSLRKPRKLLKSSFKRVIASSKSQVHYFSYVSWLALGFLIGRLSRMSDNWSPPSSGAASNNLLARVKWW
ncbi:uncharacterized protein [Venturia canescens]|uniref:uncharacterized protein n=1 Tax=Venturia canescens TaxID=32260 RepID=UPI001C9D5898|nr:uncharacterized protein LOC122417652 [Venturia canescens]